MDGDAVYWNRTTEAIAGGGVTKREMRCFGLVMVTDEIVKLSCRIDSSWVVLLVFTF